MAPRPATVLGPLLLLVCSGLGCAGAEGVARRAVPATLDESVGFLEDPESQRRIQRLLADPQIQQASRELTAALVEGALDGAADETRQSRLRDASTQFIDTVAKAAARNLQEDISPALTRSVQHALAGALSPRTRREASAFVDALTRSTVAAFAQSAGHGLRSELGPALRGVIEDDVGPALQHVLAADLAPALREAVLQDMVPVVGVVSREAARAIVLGVADGLEEVEFRSKFGTFQDNLWVRLDSLLHKGIKFSQIAAWILGLGVVALALLFGRAVVIRRRIEEERARSERMLLAVMNGIQQGTDKPEIEALLAQLREHHPDLASDIYLEELARRAAQPGRKVTRPRRRL